MLAERNVRARRLFEGIASAYEGPAAVLGLGQYGRWRRFAVSRLDAGAGALVCDVATGTGLVARDLARRGARVVGIDLTEAMLRRAVARGLVAAVARAERLPFRDAAFDHLVFTYLLRYVDDPGATIAEMARVVRPGGQMVSVEFGIPAAPIARRLWRLYVHRVLPLLSRMRSRGWAEVGTFLGPSIEDFAARWPPEAIEDLWRSAGMTGVRTRRLSLGGGLVTWGRKR